MRRTNELTPDQKWEQATLADNFIFCKVMSSNPDLCKELLEMLIGIEIDRIEQPPAEHSLKSDYGAKGIRFDVYVKDGTGRCFDVEVQITSRYHIARRARCYQSLMDGEFFPSDADCSDLKEGYVIFLCMDDPFGRGLPVYTFGSRCREDQDILLNDGAHKIFYNAAKHAVMPSESLKSFFGFLAGADDGSALSGRLAAVVEDAKTNEQWRRQFVTWEEDIRLGAKEAVEAAREDARAEVAVETARKLLGKDFAVEIIADVTGLPLAQVEQLRQEASAVRA